MSASVAVSWVGVYAFGIAVALAVWPVYVLRNFHRLMLGNRLFALGAGMLFLDQAAKYWAVHYLRPLGRAGITVIPGFFKFTYVENRGAAFGLFPGQINAFIAIALFTVAVILFYLSMVEEDEKMVAVALVLILAGAVGNLIDRARLGYVIDYLLVHYGDAWHWPVFNWADTIIDVGVGLIVLDVIRDWWTEEPEADPAPVE